MTTIHSKCQRFWSRFFPLLGFFLIFLVGCETRSDLRRNPSGFNLGLPGDGPVKRRSGAAGARPVAKSPVLTSVSKVLKVREEDRFVIVESPLDHQAGQPLFAWRAGRLVAKLQITDPVRFRDPNFWVANIVSGTPRADDLVYDEVNLPKGTQPSEPEPVSDGDFSRDPFESRS